MDWSNEPYVRVYTRETDDDLALSWDALSVWRAMLLRFDRSGMIETRRGARGLAAVLRAPSEVVERSLPELLEDGRIVQTDRGFMAPNFIEAQEATKSDRLRQKESRDRRRARNLDQPVTKSDASVTSGHERSQVVTLTSADPDPLLDSALLDVAKRDDLPLPEQIPLPEVARSPETSLEGDLSRSLDVAQRHGAARRDLWAQLNAARAQLAQELGVSLRPLHPQDPGERALGLRLRESESLAIGIANAEHVIAVALAEARATGSGEWLTGVVFEDRGWRRALGTTPEHAARARPRAAGPRGPQDEPARRIKAL